MTISSKCEIIVIEMQVLLIILAISSSQIHNYVDMITHTHTHKFCQCFDENHLSYYIYNYLSEIVLCNYKQCMI